MAEGFSMVMYPSRLVDVDSIERDSSRTIDCFRSDDITISNALEKKHVPRFALSQDATSMGQLSFGFEADALHQQQDHTTAYYKCLLQTDHYE